MKTWEKQEPVNIIKKVKVKVSSSYNNSIQLNLNFKSQWEKKMVKNQSHLKRETHNS